MGITVTLDEDVARLLRGAMEREHLPLKECLNRALRRALTRPAPKAAVEIAARSMGLRDGIDAARLNQLADQLEAGALAERMRVAEAAERRRQARRHRR